MFPESFLIPVASRRVRDDAAGGPIWCEMRPSSGTSAGSVALAVVAQTAGAG